MHRTRRAAVCGWIAMLLLPVSPAIAGTTSPLPTVTKAFSPTVINDGNTSVLVFTIDNTAGSVPVTNVGFVDDLPSGIVIANQTVGGTCANAAAATTVSTGGSKVTTANLQVSAGATCVVTVNVTNASGQTNESCGANPVAFTNGSTNVAVTNAVNGVQPSCLVVHSTTPTLTKSFSPASINDGEATVLTFAVANPAGAPSRTNVGFVDTLPSGLVVASNTVGGTCVNAAAATTLTIGGSTITVTGLEVPAGSSSCTVTVDVTNASGQTNESCGANPAAFTNDAGNVEVTNVVNGVEPSCLVVHGNNPPPPAPAVPALTPGSLAFLAATVGAAGMLVLRRFSG